MVPPWCEDESYAKGAPWRQAKLADSDAYP
jgi:hypothetical protein